MVRKIFDLKMGGEHWLLFFLILLIALAALFQVMMDWNMSRAIFFPIREYSQLPSQKYREFNLPTGAVAWEFLPAPGRPIILYCHGNAANISYWNHIIDLAHSQGLNILIFDYRGFGQAPGVPYLPHLLEDGLAAYDYLYPNHTEIIVWGESMGGAVALHIASNRVIWRLCLAATFSSVKRVAELKGFNPFYQWLGERQHNLNNVRLLKQISVPTVIIHSTEDEIVPFQCAQELFAAVQHSCKKLVPVKGSHTRPVMGTRELAEVFHFCQLDTSLCQAAEPHLRAICQDCRQFAFT